MSDFYQANLATDLRIKRRGGFGDGQGFQAAGNELDHQLVAGGLPPYAELTRRGKRWKVATATAFASIQALPTTGAKLEIKNGSATDSMVIDTIWSWQLLGTAVVWSHTPWAQVGAPVQGTVTALVIYDGNGASSYASAVGLPAITSINDTVVANGWECFPGSTMNFGLAAATPGGACIGQVDGRLIVPPGRALHLAVTGSVSTASAFQCGASWFWAPITNE